jgi:uncharacterized protein YprB with RNaseH-like and TPR domain
MPSLSDKLKSLGVKLGAQGIQPPPPRDEHPIEHVLPGRYHRTPAGDAYIVDERYPYDHLYGSTRLRLTTPLKTISQWAGLVIKDDLGNSEEHSFHLPRFPAYLDIETTGLSGGTGIYAFLIGIGRFEDEGFHLAQFFMRDPAEEPAILLAIEEFIAPCDSLVTYNGKSFDVPILNTRYIAQHWESPLRDLPNLDLLYLARRLWRDRLSSRSLGNIETFILGARRSEEDIPGWMIPQMYFDYLRSGDARPLRSVFYHNAMDILAIAALLNYLAQLLERPSDSQPEVMTDLLGVARLYEELGRLEEAALIYKQCLEAGLPETNLWEAVKRLSYLKKRTGDYPSAITLWEQAAKQKHVYAHVELAKYFEHQVHQYEDAARWTREAITIVIHPGTSTVVRQEWLAELEHRLARLERLLGYPSRG